MLVFKVDVEEVDGGFEVTCPDVPGVRRMIGSLWDACTVRPTLAKHAGVPDDLVWLQIRAYARGVTVKSDVHPLHWVACHSLVRPAHPAFDRSDVVFQHALTALQHEADQADQQGRMHTQVRFVLCFLDNTRVPLPRHQGFALRDIIDGTRVTGDLSAWIRARLNGVAVPSASWSSPVVGLQIGIFGPDAAGPRRFR